ncbi:mucin-2 isoform X3 [Calliphora vicina]|uniref:mucin-2 isoform X3 n=1 Tax=Calliphora vicina TaxID=7373 RepID=UPI00325BBDF8
MSDSQKQQRPGATPIKNPLLSASVTGLTFDDFPNKPLLLPAAPPIVHATVPAPVVTPSGLIAREHKSLVTLGSSSLDTENLDEINLNASNEDSQTSDITDPNPLLEQSNQGVNTDSILSQAASSFSALPSVASNVFSTFSKRITAISSRETTPTYDQYQQDFNSNTLAPQLDIQPTYTQQQYPQQGNLPQVPPPFYAPPQGGNYISSNSATLNQQDTQTSVPPAVEPPKFYTPAEVPPIPSASGAPPANLGGQNNFRFTSKKKLYAPIPGLSDQSQSPSTTLDPSTVSAPISYDTPYGGNTLYQQSQYPPAEERKPGSGLFSKISNLAPAGVLQNITGLVQSAAGSLTQTIKTDSYQPTPAPVVDQQNNYFAGPPPPTNYFVPPSLSGQQTNPQTTLTTTEYTNTSQNTQPSSFFIGQQPEPTPFTPFDTNPSSQSANFFNLQPTTTTLPPAAVLFQCKPPPSTETSPTQIPFFNPTNLPPQINPNPSSPPTSQPLRPNRPPSRPPSHPSSSYLPPNPNEQSVTTQSNPTEPALDTAPQIVFFDPTKYLPSSSQTSAITPTSLTTHPLPPTADHKIPPPASGQTSYRLQKGTKLYKNPLTPQETAPVQAINQSVHSFTAQPSFAAPQSVPVFANDPLKSVPLFAPTPVGELKSHPSFATPQSVPLFTSPVGELISSEPIQSIPTFAPPPVADLISNKSVQSVPLFASTVEELKSNESTQSVPLFVPPVDEVTSNQEAKQNIPLVDPQVDEIKTEASTQNLPLFASLVKEHKSNEPWEEHKNNEPEHSVTTEVTKLLDAETENKVATQVPKQDTNSQESQPIFEPIEPVVEDNSTEIQTEEIKDSLEQTIQKLSLTESSSETKTLTLPPITTQGHTSNNPYRRGSTTETTKPAVTQPTLANFFTPVAPGDSGDLNFFATLPATEPSLANSNSGIHFFSEAPQDNKEISEPKGTLQAETTNFFNTELSSSGLDVKPDLIPFQPHTAIHPPITAFFPTLPTSLGLVPAVLEDKNNITKHLNESFVQGNVLPPIGFESFAQSEPSATVIPDNTTVQQETSSQTKQPEIVNRFSNYFNQTNQQQEIAKDPSTFFDSFPGQQVPQLQPQHPVETNAPVAAANEEQRIQFFFNNPPPKDASAVGDLNYDLVHSGLGIKKLQQRSLTPISNLVEPPSSACSEFSEISNSTAGQKSIGANLSITGISEKSIEKEENKSIDNSVTLEQDSTATDTITKHYEELPEEILKELRMANILSADKSASSSMASVSYKPAVKHWFFKRTISDKQLWIPFSHYDSALLETSLLMEDEDEKPNIVAVEGGRYDVNISERKKMSVYWESEPIEVRRCSWFYKAVDSKYVPYEEQTAEVLEKEYKQAAESGVWHKTIILGMGEQVVFHGPTVIVHFQQQQNSDAWGGTTKQTATRPRVVKRDLDDFNIEQGESQKVDHLLFMVHGIGSACDLKLRSVEEVVEDFRTIARQLVQSHYKNSTDLGLVGRVEVLPISWHSHLHSAEMGIDEKLRLITLESIPKLRNFTNDTLLDILFYTSPTFCQKIMNTIVSSMNTLYLKYRERHPEFNGGVSLAGHSLGSLILFDLLCHQNPIKESEEKNLENPDKFLTPSTSNTQMDSNQLEDKQISYTMGPAGTGQPFINYGQLIFQPKKFFALGSPIGMFVTIRGIDKLGLDFRLPTCPGFYNIFHPYDPVAYRIEALVNPDLSGVRPVLIPHHKGRKRMHLELKETMTRVSMDLKNRFLDKFKTTLDSVNIFGSTTKCTKEAEELMEKEVDKVIQMQMALEQQNNNQNSHAKLTSEIESQNGTTTRQRTDSVSTAMSEEVVELDLPLGKLNDSKRVDYVLQEAPLEFINEYIFALSSHVCYWDSEDTILFVMKEIYSGLGISPDSQVPQQTMTIERPSSRNSLLPSS